MLLGVDGDQPVSSYGLTHTHTHTVLKCVCPSRSPALGSGASVGGEAECGQLPCHGRQDDAPERPQLPPRLQGGVRGEGPG